MINYKGINYIMLNNHKYGITPQELKEARKYIIQDIKSKNKVDNPIYNMTLNIYFDMIKECMLGTVNENGIVVDPWDNTWYSESRKQDIRSLPSVEVARIWMDSRGLFSKHFNSSLYKNEKHYGNWDNINQHEQNQWYYEDRLDDTLWFKECVAVIGHGGHPTECIGCGNFTPVEYESNKWYIRFDTFSRSDYYMFKGYLYMKRKGYPVFIYGCEKYLTNKQVEKLRNEGYIK